MSRFATMFAGCQIRKEGALGAFWLLGDPDPQGSLNAIDSLVEGGADFLEVGIPFSDPVADGPVIQAAALRALGAGMTTKVAMELIAEVRSRHPAIPIGVLTYANLAVSDGFDSFVKRLAQSGADALLLADVPALEAGAFAERCRAKGLDWVMIAASNTPEPTLRTIAALASGFTYCVTRAGVTGHGDAAGEGNRALLSRLAHLRAPPPVLGFGIGSPEQVAAALEQGAEGAIVGSALVERGGKGEPLASFVRALKHATHGGHSQRLETAQDVTKG